MSLRVWWRGLADGSRRGMPVALLKLLLAVPAMIYSELLRVRALLYRHGIFTSYRLPCPVISVGNLAVGGTGKTPVTALIARLLMQQGKRVAVLSRGYGGTLKGAVAVVSDGRSIFLTPDLCGDEPCLLAGIVPGLMVVVGADRYRAGLLALERLQPDLLLLDDGFQHIRLQRDLNILLLDADRPFGNGWTLPLGLLREPGSALRRADLVIFTRCRPGRPVMDPGLPHCCSEHRLAGFRRLTSGEEISLELLRQARVAACAGIAEPDAFFAGLREIGIAPMASCALPDHAAYTEEHLSLLDSCMAQASPDWLLTTEKDGVKLAVCARPWLSRVVTVRLELRLSDGGTTVGAALDKLLSDRA